VILVLALPRCRDRVDRERAEQHHAGTGLAADRHHDGTRRHEGCRDHWGEGNNRAVTIKLTDTDLGSAGRITFLRTMTYCLKSWS